MLGEPKIKLYKDDNDQIKGDALVMYFKPESVQLAISLLDEAEFRPNISLRISRAIFSQHSDNISNPSSTLDSKTKKRKLEAIKKKLEWFDPQEGKQNEAMKKTVIFEHLFDPSEIASDPSISLDIKEDLMDECSKLGNVTSIVIYEKSQGIASVKFSDEISAFACVQKMHNRFYDKRRLIASIMTSELKQLLKQEHQKRDSVTDQERLENFGQWLESHHEDENDP